MLPLKTCGQIGAGGDGDCALSIVSVQVKSSKGQSVSQTYAYLDPGSSATFGSERLMHSLKLKGNRTNIVLKTMGNQKTIISTSLIGLDESSLLDDIFYSPPEVFTQERLPVSRDNIGIWINGHI